MLQDTDQLREAEPLLRRALELDEAIFGEHHPNVAVCLNNLATLLHDTNRPQEAEPLMRRALEIDRGRLRRATPDRGELTWATWRHYYRALNRTVEAEPLIRRALEIDKATFGERHPAVATRLNNLASLLHATSRPSEAEPLMRRSLNILESFGRQTGHEHPYFQRATENYQALQQTKELAERTDWQRQLHAIVTRDTRALEKQRL